ncbi:MAG: MFS transporter [Oscillochloridaceae bacterium]|nr:MFS transporter [Chloroflexaceae bacterium]MDW8391722.1 MFS transporter [Oscillochloridaceae bacterium]
MDRPVACRRRGLIALMAITFLMYAGFFMVIPLVSVHYIERLGFAATLVGVALAVRQLLQQGGTLVGGVLADRFGARRLIGVGVLVRATGFISLAWATSPVLLFVAMILSALGGALFESPSRAAVAALTHEAERARFYSVIGVISGLGMTLGPLTGALLLRFNFQAVALGAAACFGLVFLIVCLLLPPVRVADERLSLGSGLNLVRRDRAFLTFTGLTMGYWFMWVQLTLSLPLAAERLTGNPETVGLVYALNAGMTVLFQYPVLRYVERFLRPLPIMIIGMALMALGLGAVAAAGDIRFLLGCVVIFTLGLILVAPTQQSITASLANPCALGSYFGVNALALAFGGALGSLAGGTLTDAAQRVGQPALPWLTFALLGLGSAIGMAMLAEHLQRRHSTAHLVIAIQPERP